MRLLRTLLAPAAVLAVLLGGVGAASAASSPARHGAVCHRGNIASGTYRGLKITGKCTVPDKAVVIVRGNLSIAKRAYFNAFTTGTVLVTGNITVGRQAVLALGCTPESEPPPSPCGTTTTRDTVGGSIIARGALTMYLDGDSIAGNVISHGGGPGATLKPFVNFPIKDNVIAGHVLVTGWRGAWFGFIRNVTLGSVVLVRNVGVVKANGKPDSTEVATNRIAGSLACFGNVPAAQFGDSHGTRNIVGGRKLGQCARL